MGSPRARHVAAIYYSPVESCKANSVNPMTYLTCILNNARNKAAQLPIPEGFATLSTAPDGGCAPGLSGVGSRGRQDADCRTESNIGSTAHVLPGSISAAPRDAAPEYVHRLPIPVAKGMICLPSCPSRSRTLRGIGALELGPD